MPRAMFNGELIADSDDTIEIEGTHYFPPASVKREYLIPTETTAVHPNLGTATYFTLDVKGSVNTNAAWSYHQPEDAAESVRDYIAFGADVQVRE